MHSIVLFHIIAASIGLLSGFMAMSLRKGSGLHGAAGTVFAVSMLGMSASGAYGGAFIKPVMINVVAGLLTFYLVSTGWRAAKRKEGAPDLFDRIALLFVISVAAGALTFGIQAASRPRGMLNGMPAFIYFMFLFFAVLCIRSDVRMFRRGSLTGAFRVRRHLWRMSSALLIATLSLYPGQARLFPQWLRDTNLLMLPHLLLFGTMIFYMVRTRIRKNAQRTQLATTGDAAYRAA